jgi:septal ring-binding cell division protein DamX
MYTFRLHLWGVVLVALGAILVGVLLAVGGCLVGEWRVERTAAGAVEGAPGTPGAPPVSSAPAGSTGEVPPPPGADAAPVTYTVRLGSFGSQEEAQAFADQVTARGYAAAVVPDETSRGTPFFHVTVGSYATRWEARGAAREIQALEERRGWRATVTTAPVPP